MAHIEACQPFSAAEPSKHPLAVLDQLTNINKHRRVLFAHLSSSTETPFGPHFVRKVNHHDGNGNIIGTTPVCLFVAFGESVVQGKEIVGVLETLSRYVGDELFPVFELFLERT
jgi:hypothetical protein